jgi:hypothetical protein
LNKKERQKGKEIEKKNKRNKHKNETKERKKKPTKAPPPTSAPAIYKIPEVPPSPRTHGFFCVTDTTIMVSIFSKILSFSIFYDN